MLGNNDTIHRDNGVKEGRVVFGHHAFFKENIHKDVAVVVGLLGFGEELQQLFAVGDDGVAYWHFILLIGYEGFVVTNVYKQYAVGHVAYLHTQKLLVVGNLLQGARFSWKWIARVTHHIGEYDDNSARQHGEKN